MVKGSRGRTTPTATKSKKKFTKSTILLCSYDFYSNEYLWSTILATRFVNIHLHNKHTHANPSHTHTYTSTLSNSHSNPDTNFAAHTLQKGRLKFSLELYETIM